MTSLINASILASMLRESTPPLVFDASWHMPGERDALQEFKIKHIAGAKFFDLNAFCDTNNSLPNMLSSDPTFLSAQLSRHGIRPDKKIVFYDNSIFHTSCRAFLILLAAGHAPNNLFILNGGMHSWEKQSGKFMSGETILLPDDYTASYQSHLLCSLKEMKDSIKNQSAQIIDLRHPIRFTGGAETRANLRSGHIPGSYSFPYLSFTDRQGYFYSPDKVRKSLFDIGININEPIISTCGSGISAPMLNFFLTLMKHPNHKLYDGSWSEWGAEQCYPGEKDLSERPVENYLES